MRFRPHEWGATMKKIPTIFERDWNGDRSKVVDKPHPDCAWVFAGEGQPTRKIDGTSCAVIGGRFFKRLEIKSGKPKPPEFIELTHDTETDKIVGWIPVTGGPENKFHMEAFRPGMPDGTYELVGPKIQGNPEKHQAHALVDHADEALIIREHVPTEFAALKAFLVGKDIEGIVWHHPDGRMVKIKLRDFGLKRP